MPINLAVKPKVAVEQPSEVAEGVSFAEPIDELGALMTSLEKIRAGIALREKKELEKAAAIEKKIKAAAEKLYPKLLEAYDDDYADGEYVEAGNKFQAEIGKKANIREVSDMKMVQELLDDQQPGLFMKLAKINLGDLDDYLTPEERQAVITPSRGKRPIKITLKA